MIPGMNPRKMAQAMKKMGIQQIDIPATEVIIKGPEKDIVIVNPEVSKVNMMGQQTYQIVGEAHEREKELEKPEISDDDIKTVVEQTKCSEEDARNALQEANGDLAAAIMSLQSDSQ